MMQGNIYPNEYMQYSVWIMRVIQMHQRYIRIAGWSTNKSGGILGQTQFLSFQKWEFRVIGCSLRNSEVLV